MNTCMIYVTAGTPEEARNIAKTLVSEGLIACANIIDGVTSIYRWEGQIETSDESVILAKTTHTQRQVAMNRARELHSYDTPCVVAYDMADGLPDYLQWLKNQTG